MGRFFVNLIDSRVMMCHKLFSNCIDTGIGIVMFDDINILLSYDLRLLNLLSIVYHDVLEDCLVEDCDACIRLETLLNIL